ncbi:MAG: hypothetical protein U0871_03855 [Gemmataceae bacterium]
MTRSWLVCGVLLAAVPAGCRLGPRSVESNRLRYNEAVKVTTEEQLLLNIVRLRYTDNPSSLSVSAIADQHELVAGLRAMPFFTAAAAGDLGTYRGSVLPQAELSAANRPTLTYTPLDDQEFTRRLFTPITLDGVAYLSKTTWPIATVFRLWLENLNWVSNAETASGPTPRQPPEYARFLAGVQALQRLQDKRLAAFVTRDKDEPVSDGLPADRVTAAALVEAAKSGFEYHRDPAAGTWTVVRKKPQASLRVDKAAASDPDFKAFCEAFRLDPTATTFELSTDRLDPFLTDAPEKGLDYLDLETRSLLQVLYFLSHGVTVPPEHLTSGVAPLTAGPDGAGFDWDTVLGGLFKVCWATGHKPPPCARVAVRYRGYWFYIDDRDRDTKATFALLLDLSRLELAGKAGNTPILTLPLGGR